MVLLSQAYRKERTVVNVGGGLGAMSKWKDVGSQTNLHSVTVTVTATTTVTVSETA